MEEIYKTLEHKNKVAEFMLKVVNELTKRAFNHDNSKLHNPERDVFSEYGKKLKTVTYGSDEYKEYLQKMKPALEHHYKNNPHHPEYFDEGIKGMSLVDLIEMICDWYAATMRHNDGDISKSIDINKDRFGYSDELAQILRNTINELKGR